jgi:hypothetical protein
MKETIKSIIEWHEQTFPDATLEGQIEKFQDEEKEFYLELTKPDNRVNTMYELADMYVVACGIARFSFIDTLVAFHKAAQAELQCLSGDELPSYINKKMEINRKRKWTIGKGNYQHVED